MVFILVLNFILSNNKKKQKVLAKMFDNIKIQDLNRMYDPNRIQNSPILDICKIWPITICQKTHFSCWMAEQSFFLNKNDQHLIRNIIFLLDLIFSFKPNIQLFYPWNFCYICCKEYNTMFKIYYFSTFSIMYLTHYTYCYTHWNLNKNPTSRGKEGRVCDTSLGNHFV